MLITAPQTDHLATMEVIETDRINIIAEKRKWQTEMENKRRQLEDDRRSLQHLKSKALRERWLLDGVPSAGPEHDEVKRQLQQDEQKTRDLEANISRLERELVILESEGGPTITPAPTVKTEPVQGVEVVSDRPALVSTVPAVYSVEIRVERDKATGETRVLSANPTLPVDPGLGVKVYEDERKVVHEMNGEDGGHILSSTEVEELIHKADEASVKTKTITTISTTAATTTTATTEKLEEEPGETKPRDVSTISSAEITGLETKPEKEPSMSEATADNPVTMVFMGYQNVEDEDETKRVLGLKGTVKAELVVIDDAEGKTSPVEQKAIEKSVQKAATPSAEKAPKEKETSPEKNGETTASSEEVRAGDTEEQTEKKKQPCKCCTIM